MSFDDIPEDYQESFQCPECELGDVTLNDSFGMWECDECDFSAEQTSRKSNTKTGLLR